PLNPVVTGRFQRQGYRVENIIFESQPGFRVTGNLYIPESGPQPFPAVIGVAGHTANGRMSATYQHAWIGFAKRGYVVLAIAPPGQGERWEYFDPIAGTSRAGGSTREHTMAGLQCLLTGSNIARYEIWDGIRAFDYLLTRPEVDGKRVAVAGNSGGGTQSGYIAALEPRLAGGVSACWTTRWRELWEKPGPQDAEQVFAGFIRDGLDFSDFALAFAPRPYLMETATRDFFPIAGAHATYEELQPLFDVIGAPKQVGFFEYDDTHGWSKERRQAAYRWLDHWLRGQDNEGIEPDIVTEPEGRLSATPTGQLATSLGSETVWSLNLARAKSMASHRPQVDRAAVLRALGINWKPDPAP